MSTSPGLTTRICLVLFGASLFASGIEVALHESGHGIAAWLLGADIDRFDVHPFRRSNVVISYDEGRRSESSLLFSTAGIAFAIGVSSIAFLAVWRRSLYLFPVSFLLPTALLVEGQYLIDGSLNNYGDPSAISSLAYLPLGVFTAIGCVLIVAGILLGLQMIARVGVDESAPWWLRSAAFLSIVSVILPAGLFNADSRSSWVEVTLFIAVGFLFLLLFALVAGILIHCLRRRLSLFLREPSFPVLWSHVAASMSAGLLVIGLMLALAHGPQNLS